MRHCVADLLIASASNLRLSSAMCIATVSAILYWVLWYLATGLPTASSVTGYAYLMCLLMSWFISSWGQWITAYAPSFTVISNVGALNRRLEGHCQTTHPNRFYPLLPRRLSRHLTQHEERMPCEIKPSHKWNEKELSRDQNDTQRALASFPIFE